MMNVQQQSADAAIPSANSASISERLRALAVRPQSMTVRDLIDRYMSQYAGQDTTRAQRLTVWSDMIDDFTLDQVDADVVHAGRTELETQPAIVFMGLDHRLLAILQD